ncbi:DNA-3-methyladenine glycosylase I [Shigella flexneri]
MRQEKRLKFFNGYVARESIEALRLGESGPALSAYHDNEWGMPETDSKKLFENKSALKGSRLGYRRSPSSKNTENFSRLLSSVQSGEGSSNAEDVERLVPGRRGLSAIEEKSGNYW